MSNEIDYVQLDNFYARQRAALYLAGINVGGLVPGEGVASNVMVICPPPTSQDSMLRRPAMGSDGRTLRSLMALAGLYGAGDDGDGVANCWLTNVIKYRMPGARNLTSMERNLIQPFLKAEWEAVGRPNIIVTIGKSTYESVLHSRVANAPFAPGEPMRCLNYAGGDAWIVPMMHPRMGVSLERYRDQIEQHWLDLGAWLAAGDGGRLVAGDWVTDDPAS